MAQTAWTPCAICKLPLDAIYFITNLVDSFGWQFVAMVFAVYGLNQGVGEGWLYVLQRYFFKDILILSPAHAQMLTAVARTPWNVKPIYGIMGDCLPIYGYHRTYYIVLAGIVGVISWLYLASTSVDFRYVVPMSVIAMFWGSHSTASPDVMIDATVAEKSRVYPSMASKLQALCASSLAVCGVLSTLSAGVLVQHVGVIHSFALMALTSAVMIPPALLGWLGEKYVKYTFLVEHRSSSLSDSPPYTANSLHILHTTPQLLCIPALGGNNCFISLELLQRQKTLVRVALIVTATVLTLGGISLATSSSTHDVVGSRTMREHTYIISFAILTAIVVVCTTLHHNLSVDLPVLTKVALFIFLRESVQIDTEQAFFYWFTECPDGPRFTPEFVGLISAVAFSTMLVGVGIYTRYLCRYSYHTIFFVAHILCIFTSLLDLVLVMRWNLSLGIPDAVFIVADFAVSPMVRKFITMPTCVLASKLCPQGAEATMFALLMSLGNFGHDISSYVGALLADELGIGNPGYYYLPHMIVVKSILRILPLVMIPLLVPDGCPQEDEAAESKLSPVGGFAPASSADFVAPGCSSSSKTDSDLEMIDMSWSSISSASVDIDTSQTPLAIPPSWLHRVPVSSRSITERDALSTLSPEFAYSASIALPVSVAGTVAPRMLSE